MQFIVQSFSKKRNNRSQPSYLAGLSALGLSLLILAGLLTTGSSSIEAAEDIIQEGDLTKNGLTRAVNNNNLCESNVAEAEDFVLIYHLDIPTSSDFNGSVVPYEVDNSALGVPFDAVGYCLQLDGDYVWVSMDDFTEGDYTQIGVPAANVNATPIQQVVDNMNVASNVAGVTTGEGIETGNIEFWNECYNQSVTLGLPNASGTAFDYDDAINPDAGCPGWGSMQVHNHGAGQTVFAYNGWDNSLTDDLGIGNQPSDEPDWTFATNAADYTSRNLYIYVAPTDPTIAAYTLDGNGFDSSGEELHAEVFNAIPTTDRFGNPNSAMYFDGDGDYIRTPVDGTTYPVSFSVWFKLDSAETGPHSIIDSDSFGKFGHSLIQNYTTRTAPDGELDIQFHDGPLSDSLGNGNTGFFPAEGEWHHAVVNFGNGEATVYVDGEQVHQFAYNPGAIDGSNFRIGRHNATDPFYFKGAIDDVGFFDRPLTPIEITLLYGAEAPEPTELTVGTPEIEFDPDGGPIEPFASLQVPDTATGSPQKIVVSIDEGYDPENDVLGFAGQVGESGTVDDIDWTFDEELGTLTLESRGWRPWAGSNGWRNQVRRATYANRSWYRNPGKPQTGVRTIPAKTISVSTVAASKLESNGHYYEFVPAANITWEAAKAAAEGRKLYGLQGYLATITSTEENDYVAAKLTGNGWIGGTDDPAHTPATAITAEKKWYWATGPEAGTHFHTQAADQNGCGVGADNIQPAGAYNNWFSPNTADASQSAGCPGNDKSYAYYYKTHPINPAGNKKWGDFPNDPIAVWGKGQQIDGYIVEYGGMAGDPTVELTTKVTLAIKDKIAGQTTCTQQALQDLLGSNDATIELDGTCNYIVDQLAQGAANGQIELYGKSDKVINGNGATISQGANSPINKVMLFVGGNSKNITLKDVTITGAKYGALKSSGTTGLALENVSFGDNTSRALEINNGTATLTNVKFENNQSTTTGGGLYVYGATVEITDGLFKENSSSDNGGGIYSQTKAKLTLNNVTFKANSGKSGGGIYASGTTLSLTDVTFTENQATLDIGGGLAQRGGTAQINDSTFKSNLALKTGGAIFADGDTATVNLTDVILEGNQASGLATGQNSEFTGKGGGLFFQGATATIKNARFERNASRRSGAAIYDVGVVNLSNSVLVNNTSPEGGALFKNGGTKSALVNNTVVTSSPLPGGAIVTWQPITLTNNIIAGYETGVQLFSDGVTEKNNLFNVTGSMIKESNSKTVTKQGGSLAVATFNFVDPAGGNYTLKNNSPAIDRGAADAGGATDAAGNPRPFTGTGVDVGAYEYQGVGIAAITLDQQTIPWFKDGDQIPFDLSVANPTVFDVTNIFVTFDIPAGATYVANSVTDGGNVTDTRLTWVVPTLKAGEDTLLEFKLTANDTFTSDGVVSALSLDDMAVFAAAEPLEVLESTKEILANLTFFPQPDGFSFQNWAGSDFANDITVNDMIRIFGEDQVCQTKDPCVLKGTARVWRDNKLATKTIPAPASCIGRYCQSKTKPQPGGHCFGMASTSLELFRNSAFNPSGIETGVDLTFGLGLESDLRREITIRQTTQSLQPVTYNAATSGNQSVKGNLAVLKELAANLDDAAATKRYILAFYALENSKRTKGHAVTPYAVEQKSDNLYWIYVYDNNYPNDFDRVFKLTTTGTIDKEATQVTKWVYEGGATVPGAQVTDYIGTTNSLNQLTLRNMNHIEAFPKKCPFCPPPPPPTPPAGGSRSVDADGDVFQFQLSGEGYILVTRNDGKRFGYDLSTGAEINEISGGSLIAMLDGSGFNTPDLIELPHTAGSTYTIQLANRPTAFDNLSSAVGLTIDGPGKIFSLDGIVLNNPEPVDGVTATEEYDVVTIFFDPESNTMKYKATDEGEDVPEFRLAVDDTGEGDFVFNIKGGTVATGKEIEVSFDPDSKKVTFKDDDTGSVSPYTVDVTRVEPDGTVDTATVPNGDGSSGGSINLTGWNGNSTPAVEPINDGFTIFLPLVGK